MNSRFIIPVLVLLLMAGPGCNREEPLPVSARFTTNIQNNTLGAKDGFTVYLQEAQGEFLAYFKGATEENSWGTGFGIPIDAATDSLKIAAYGAAGTYTFTLVATSYGNWGETVDQDVRSIEITVTEDQK
jgi:hypothetical protein